MLGVIRLTCERRSFQIWDDAWNMGDSPHLLAVLLTACFCPLPPSSLSGSRSLGVLASPQSSECLWPRSRQGRLRKIIGKSSEARRRNAADRHLHLAVLSSKRSLLGPSSSFVCHGMKSRSVKEGGKARTRLLVALSPGSLASKSNRVCLWVVVLTLCYSLYQGRSWAK